MQDGRNIIFKTVLKCRFMKATMIKKLNQVGVITLKKSDWFDRFYISLPSKFLHNFYLPITF